MSTPVVVIGAGLGGLALARVLQRHGVAVVVHDRDASPTARAQGGMLDMHTDTGLAALRAAGLEDGFRAAVLPGGEATRVIDRHGTVRLDEADDGDGERPEIARGTLRDLLLDSLEPGTVRWGSTLTGARPLGDGRHELTFADGSVTTTTVLVGADGAWSRVRPLVSAAWPAYTGVGLFITRFHDADRTHPAAAAVVGGGTLMALGAGRGLLAHREPAGELELYVAVVAPEERVVELGARDATELVRGLADEFADWHPDLRALVTGADEPFVGRPIHALPVGHRWERVPGVTLLGDAAHLMSPFAGEGANLALRDGADLAAALVEHGTATPAAVERALAAYEEVMVPRAAAAAAESAANLEIAFAADAPEGLLAVVTGNAPA